METKLEKLEKMFEDYNKQMNDLKQKIELLNMEIVIIDKLIGDLYARL